MLGFTIILRIDDNIKATRLFSVFKEDRLTLSRCDGLIYSKRLFCLVFIRLKLASITLCEKLSVLLVI